MENKMILLIKNNIVEYLDGQVEQAVLKMSCIYTQSHLIPLNNVANNGFQERFSSKKPMDPNPYCCGLVM